MEYEETRQGYQPIKKDRTPETAEVDAYMVATVMASLVAQGTHPERVGALTNKIINDYKRARDGDSPPKIV